MESILKTAKIYKLTNDQNQCYIGTTSMTLNRRLSLHRASQCNFTSSRELFKNGSTVKIELLEDYPCKSREELHKREQYYMDIFQCVNKRRKPTTNQKQLLYCRKYRENNKEYFRNYMRTYRKNKLSNDIYIMKWFDAVKQAREKGLFSGRIPAKGTEAYNKIKALQEGKETPKTQTKRRRGRPKKVQLIESED